MRGFKKTSRMVRAAAAALASVAIGAGTAQAYPQYDDYNPMTEDCATCHPDFKSVGSLHNQHVINFDIQLSPFAPQFSTLCNVCHPNGGGTTPVYTFGSNTVNGGGLGCAGCHGQDYGETAGSAPYAGNPKASGWGLRQVHQDAGVLQCQGCHGLNPDPVLDETVNPPYYAMKISLLRNACDSDQEDLSYDDPPNHSMDFVGLDNDGNGFADYPNDPNCPLPTTTTSTTTTSTTSTTTTTLPVTCGVSPAVGCTAAAKAKLLVSEKAAGKEKLKFQLIQLVPAVVQGDFGSPVASDTSYALCVYDDSDVLLGSYEVSRGGDTCDGAPCWSNFKDTGFAYKDKLLSADGVSKIQLAGGDAGKGKVKVLGKNKEATLPTGVAALLSGATSATAQFINSDGDCFGMALPTVKTADGFVFSASAP